MDYLLLTENLTTPIGKLDNMTDGKHFCHYLPITFWDIPLPLLEDGSYMFADCKFITDFTIALPNLVNGSYMFCRLQYF